MKKTFVEVKSRCGGGKRWAPRIPAKKQDSQTGQEKKQKKTRGKRTASSLWARCCKKSGRSTTARDPTANQEIEKTHLKKRWVERFRKKKFPDVRRGQSQSGAPEREKGGPVG